jgi:glycosyltransferase involved in cell wall biosynthesis
MKLLFICDFPFVNDGGDIYAAAFPASIWENNYLPYFDSITVIGRLGSKEKDKTEICSVGDNRVEFIMIPEYKSIRHFFINYSVIKEKIAEQIRVSDITALRLPGMFGFISVNILIKYNKPFFLEAVENAFDGYWNYGSIAGKLSAHYLDGLMKRAFRKAPFAAYVSKSLQNDYPTKGTSEILSDVVVKDKLAAEAIEKTRFNAMEFRIGLVGGFSARYKGQDVLLKAVSLLEEAIKNNISLCFIGVGDYTWVNEYAAQLHLAKNIQFIGRMPNSDVFNLLANLSLYVQPSSKEGMPRAMLEAMSRGCPVLASAIAGIPEVIPPEYLHTPKDYKTLSGQIKMLYGNRDLLERASLQNLELVTPFLKENLDKKRKYFYTQIIQQVQHPV